MDQKESAVPAFRPDLLPLTATQEKRRKSIERRMRACLKELQDLALEAGAKRPSLYYECEGELYVFDREHPNAEDYGFSRVRAVCLSVGLAGPGVPSLDCGAW